MARQQTERTRHVTVTSPEPYGDTTYDPRPEKETSRPTDATAEGQGQAQERLSQETPSVVHRFLIVSGGLVRRGGPTKTGSRRRGAQDAGRRPSSKAKCCNSSKNCGWRG